MTRILHIAEESTYLRFAVSNFEIVNPGRNHFLINGNIHQHADLDVSEDSENITRAQFGTEAYLERISNADQRHDLIIFHNVGALYKNELAEILKGRLPIHGVFWGYEIYDSPMSYCQIWCSEA